MYAGIIGFIFGIGAQSAPTYSEQQAVQNIQHEIHIDEHLPINLHQLLVRVKKNAQCTVEDIARAKNLIATYLHYNRSIEDEVRELVEEEVNPAILCENKDVILWNATLSSELCDEKIHRPINCFLYCPKARQFPVPLELVTQDHGYVSGEVLKRVLYLESQRQGNGWSCGPRSLAHAGAWQCMLNTANELGNPNFVVDYDELRQRFNDLYREAGIESSRRGEAYRYMCVQERNRRIINSIILSNETIDEIVRVFGLPDAVHGIQLLDRDFFLKEACAAFIEEDNLCDALRILTKLSSSKKEDPIRSIVALLSKTEVENGEVVPAPDFDEAVHVFRQNPDALERALQNTVNEQRRNLIEQLKEQDSVLKYIGELLRDSSINASIRLCLACILTRDLGGDYTILSFLEQVFDNDTSAEHVAAITSFIRDNEYDRIKEILELFEAMQEDPLERVRQMLDEFQGELCNDDMILCCRKKLENNKQEDIAVRCILKRKFFSRIEEAIYRYLVAIKRRIEKPISEVLPQEDIFEDTGIVRSNIEQVAGCGLPSGDCRFVIEAFDGTKIDGLEQLRTIFNLKDPGLEARLREICNVEFPCLRDAQALLRMPVDELSRKFDVLKIEDEARPDHLALLSSCDTFHLSAGTIHILSRRDPDSPQLTFHEYDPILEEDLEMRSQLWCYHTDFEDLIIRLQEEGGIQNRIVEAIKRDFQERFVAAHQYGAHYFVCHLTQPEHWIMIALVNMPGRPPFLAMHDSCNSAIVSRPDGREICLDTVLVFIARTFLSDFIK